MLLWVISAGADTVYVGVRFVPDQSRNSHVGEPISDTFNMYIFFILVSHFLDSQFSSIASSSATSARHVRMHHNPSCLHSPPPFLSLFALSVFFLVSSIWLLGLWNRCPLCALSHYLTLSYHPSLLDNTPNLTAAILAISVKG